MRVMAMLVSLKGVIFVCGMLFVMSGCGQPVANRDSKGACIVCFGDSLTEGYGADVGQDYPSILRKMVYLPVINAGVSGNTTRDALARLETDVLSRHPRLVIITLGGNDAVQNLPKEETLRNMERIIDRILADGAMVVWATVKTGLLGDAYTEDFRDLARRKHIILIPDILRDIMFNPENKFDYIHPNNRGYRLMAERIYRTIKPLLRL